jgi:GT2 family glycosyltransferase
MNPGRRPKIVLLGMMTKIPVAGVVWQTLHYLLGFQRLGFDPYYVEAHARTPGMLMRSETDDSGALAAGFIRSMLARFGLDDRWAYQSLHADERLYGLSDRELRRLYSSADLIINMHGGTEPRPEHYETGRLVYLETDPVQLQIELYDELQQSIDFLEPHIAFFTFGECYGRPGCGLPVSERFAFRPTRQPVVLDLWLGGGHDSGTYTTIGNWSQSWRNVTYAGERYSWSKEQEFHKFLALPSLSGRSFELALSSYGPHDRELLEARGWRVRHALDFSTEPDPYRDYIRGSRGEFTVAKEQNVRLKTGWFSDRAATYLAAGRPVINQDTGFGEVLPTGEALFAFTTVDDVLAAFETIESDYQRARRAAFELASEHLDAARVLGKLLEDVGVAQPGRGRTMPATALPAGLDLVPVSRRPTTLHAETVDAALDRPIPDTGGDRLGRRRHDASVVVVAPDGLAFTRLCLESVLLNSPNADAELIVVDNGSTDGTHQYLSELAERDSRIVVLRSDENRGFPAAVNQGLGAARGDVLVLLNNDTIVAPGWLGRLAQCVQDPSVGMAGPVTNRIGTEAEIPADYRTYGEFLDVAHARALDWADQVSEVQMLAMFCAALRREVYEAIGPLDEGFGLGLLEDDDYALRLTRAGYRLVCAEDVFVHHFGEASFGRLVSSGLHARLLRSNKARYAEKWGRPWEPYERRPDARYRGLVEQIRKVVDRELPGDATVLVVSNGDDELLNLGANRRGWHFPQMEDGTYAGHHPGDSAEALAHLEALLNKGAEWILFPQTAYWWLAFYEELRERLMISETQVDGRACVLAHLLPIYVDAEVSGEL